MRFTTTLVVASLLVACAPKAEEVVTDSTDAAAVATVPALVDFAGTWNLSSTLEGVAAPVSSSITGGADYGSWTMSLEGRDPVTLEVAVHGDSLVTESFEYESILRKGVMVRVRMVAALTDGMLMGTMTATYRSSTGEELVNGTVHGTRATP